MKSKEKRNYESIQNKRQKMNQNLENNKSLQNILNCIQHEKAKDGN